MDELARFMKAVSIHASGDDYEDIAYVDLYREDDDDEFLGMDAIDDWVLWVVWFQQEEGIVKQLAEKLLISNKLTAEWVVDKLQVRWNDEEHILPLSSDNHNSYITLSSLACLLRESHDFWLLKHLMGDNDRHAILVTTKAQSDELTANYPGPASRWFVPLKLGHDYFCGIDVPYLDHEDHNPLFDTQREAVAPIVRQIREQFAKRDAELSAEHRESEAWQNELRGVGSTSKLNVSKIMQMSTDAGKKRASALEAHTHKLTQLRQEIAQIVRQTGR